MGKAVLVPHGRQGRAPSHLEITAPPVFPDEVVQLVARTLADELAQPLTLLIGTLEL